MNNPAVPRDRSERPPRRHLMIITGTGRAGTSFLVQYLAGLGLDTELSRPGDNSWYEQANAGLETLPLTGPTDRLPYIVKSPWMVEYMDQILAKPELAVDLVVVPVRDLVEAASSRVILEMQAMHQSRPWMTGLDGTWETWGTVPGGMLHSLNPLDQARIIAVGFHRLVQRVIEADVPMVFLGFPRLTTDADYVFTKLERFLPASITRETARAVHQRLADAAMVRVGDELSDESREASQPAPGGVLIPSLDRLDRIAIKRELARLRVARADDQASLQKQNLELQQHKAEIARLREEAAAEVARLHNEANAIRTEAEGAGRRATAEAARLRGELDAIHAQAREINAVRLHAEAEVARLRLQIEAEPLHRFRLAIDRWLPEPMRRWLRAVRGARIAKKR